MMSEAADAEGGVPLNRSRLMALAAIAMLLAGLGYVIVEAVVASAWTDPPYNYIYDQIPDLGNPTCGPFQERVICSPLYGLMNAMFVVHGILFGVASVLLSRLLAGVTRAVVFVLALVYAVGLSMITIFYQHAGMPPIVEVLNITGAFLGIVAGSIIAIIFGTQRRRLLLPSWLGPASVVLGVVGIVAGIVFFALSLAPLGVRERVSIYPLILWQIVAGLALLWAWWRG